MVLRQSCGVCRRMESVVSVQPQPWPEPASEIAATIRAMYSGKREVPLPVRVRDQLGELFADDQFALSAAAPHWVAQVLEVSDWNRRYARRIDTWRLCRCRKLRPRV